MILRTLADPDPKRSGFTLVEMLVVIAIIGLIAGIGVFAVQPFQSRSSVNNGGVLLQSWLNAARSRAIRDRAPRGLRLLAGDEIQNDAGANITTLITKCVFVDQPEDITGIGVSTGQSPSKTLTLTNPSATPTAGDYIEVGGGTMHEIFSVSGATVTLKNNFPYSISAAAGTNVPYRITRTPQVAAAAPTNKDATSSAQDILRVPRGSAINVFANYKYDAKYKLSYPGSATNINTNLAANNWIDIMFNPTGAVATPAVNNDKIILWVTGTARDKAGVFGELQGQPALVVVYAKSGTIAGYSADIATTGKPYSQVP